ncbi:MAG TPA: DUF6518 family protein [Solirubrobacteraceae bacterium]
MSGLRPSYRACLIAAAAGLLFGGADQYLGSRVALGPWASSLSGMSAPWLLLPFLCGLTQTSRRPAALAGLSVTVAALLGYFALTLSPLEGVAVASVPRALVGLAQSNLPWIVGGLVGGPLFGLLGERWRTRRSWPAATAVAASFCLEPLARLATGRLTPAVVVWLLEATLGCAMVAYVLAASRLGAGSRKI